MKKIAVFLALGALMAAGMAHAGTSETLASGVIVEHVKVGTGAKPTADSTVTVHYQGALTDGTVFDSSYKRGQPISFPLRGVVPCWTQGLQTMQVGGVANLTCPSSTAYGDRGVPGVIPPGATLNFKVELLGIK